MEKNNRSFILASGSPRRKKLLELFDIPFTVHPSPVSEDTAGKKSPEQIVRTLALRKAREIVRHYTDAIILGADTLVVHKNTILGKPETPEQAEKMLRSLSESTHRVLTGVALIKIDETGESVNQVTFAEITKVTFGELSESEIASYVNSGSPMDKAGSYGIQDDWGAIFVKRIEGDYYNIVGLPLHALYNRLKRFAPELLDRAEK